MDILRIGRGIPRNRKPRICPCCDGAMVKAGKLHNKQLWVCRDCKRRTIHPIIGGRAVEKLEADLGESEQGGV